MRRKILVTYSVKYCKEIELEVNENINSIFKVDTIITADDFPTSFTNLEEQPEISDLPIPVLAESEGRFDLLEVEYIDGSFEVESFELIEK
jgi:hypothetical protein